MVNSSEDIEEQIAQAVDEAVSRVSSADVSVVQAAQEAAETSVVFDSPREVVLQLPSIACVDDAVAEAYRQEHLHRPDTSGRGEAILTAVARACLEAHIRDQLEDATEE